MYIQSVYSIATKIQETGFFPESSPVTKYSRKNPVSDYPPIKNKTTANSQSHQQLFHIFNADGETRTRKDIMPHAPQACAYTNSATSAFSDNLWDFLRYELKIHRLRFLKFNL